MTFQLSITGEETWVGNDSQEIAKLLEKFPAAASNTGMFFYFALRERCPWIAQLSEDKQRDLKAFCRDTESLRRRRQEHRAKEEEKSKGNI